MKTLLMVLIIVSLVNIGPPSKKYLQWIGYDMKYALAAYGSHYWITYGEFYVCWKQCPGKFHEFKRLRIEYTKDYETGEIVRQKILGERYM